MEGSHCVDAERSIFDYLIAADRLKLNLYAVAVENVLLAEEEGVNFLQVSKGEMGVFILFWMQSKDQIIQFAFLVSPENSLELPYLKAKHEPPTTDQTISFQGFLFALELSEFYILAKLLDSLDCDKFIVYLLLRESI